MSKDIKIISEIISASLDCVPVVEGKKVKREVRGQPEVVEQLLIRDVSLREILSNLKKEFPGLEQVDDLVLSFFTILRTLGIIEITGRGGQSRISATSTSASALLRNLSFYLRNYPGIGKPIIQHSPIDGFISVLQEQISKGFLDPHLLVSNLFAHSFYRSNINPFRNLRVISVLLKGKRVLSQNSEEIVYLHVYKPAWGSYALIGSRQERGQTDEETARIAIDEDLETPATEFSLQDPMVDDFVFNRPEISNGLHTRYEFNLFFVSKLATPLKFRNDLTYRWFTRREIHEGQSSQGEAIITRYELIKSLDEIIGLSEVPIIVDDVSLLDKGSWRTYSIQIAKGAKLLFRGVWNLVTLAGQGIWNYRWWLFSLVGIIGLALMLKPLWNREWTILGNLDSLIGVVMFLIYIIGIIRKINPEG